MKICELQDHRTVIEVKVENEELVPIALNGFSSSQEPFVGVFVFVRSYPPLRGFGMISSRKKQG
jgi:hypothetical protein